MNPLSWLASLLTSPPVLKFLSSTLGEALSSFFSKQAARLEVKSAVKAARAATTAEEFRDASRKLSDASNCPKP